MCVLVRISVAMIKHHGWKKSFICLTLLHHTPITEGRQGRKSAGTGDRHRWCVYGGVLLLLSGLFLMACSWRLKEGMQLLELELQMVVNHPVWTQVLWKSKKVLNPWVIPPVLLQPPLILYKIICFNKVYFSIFSFVVHAWGLKCKKLLSSLGL